MKTIKDFLKENSSFSMTCHRVLSRFGRTDAWALEAQHYICILNNARLQRSIVIEYSQGRGIKQPPKLSDVLNSLAHDASCTADGFKELVRKLWI